MKKLANIRFLFVLIFVGTTISCVQDDDFDLPEITFEEPDVTVNSSIQFVKDYYAASGSETPVLISGENLVLEGYVVSSDKAGNLYKELIIQSHPENPEAGIAIQTQVQDLYTFFEPGRKVYVKLGGLYVGEDAGVIQLGGLFVNEGEELVGRLTPATFNEHVLRSVEVVEITPTTISIDEISNDQVNTLVKLENMQFLVNLLGESYGNTGNTFSVDRTLKNCETGATIVLRNSGFSNFKNQLLPEGNGSITAILSKFNEDYQLFIRDPEDVVFEGPRCDPETLCEGPSGGNFVVFSDDFESYGSFADAEAAGWINTNVNGGPTKFVLGSFDNDNYAQISGFDSGESEIITYLISPEINLENSTEEALTFDLEVAYANGEILTLLITENYTGDPTTTSWTELELNVPNTPSNGFGGFENVGNLNISCFDGTVRMAFLYEGSDPSATTRYHLDNIEVNGVEE
ncbi:MAG TPA: DUF5689 domain-containing protein [Flavobacteriaceae bacterium]|nr:DUF5689 domain-containing protein [Flavobacteriaceae bacterium]